MLKKCQKLTMCVKALQNKWVFRRFLNEVTDVAHSIWYGNWFHNVGAATENDISPAVPVINFDLGTCKDMALLERMFSLFGT